MIETLLSRLEKVKQKGPGQYVACCPAHDDSDPSLSIGQGDDGRILLKCWAGCGALDVISALGMEWDDLFPDKRKNYQSLARHFGLDKSTKDDRIVDLANHVELTPSRRAEIKQAILRGGKADGFCADLKKKLADNVEWSRQLLECERELLKLEMEFCG
jgi:DNA primase